MRKERGTRTGFREATRGALVCHPLVATRALCCLLFQEGSKRALCYKCHFGLGKSVRHAAQEKSKWHLTVRGDSQVRPAQRLGLRVTARRNASGD